MLQSHSDQCPVVGLTQRDLRDPVPTAEHMLQPSLLSQFAFCFKGKDTGHCLPKLRSRQRPEILQNQPNHTNKSKRQPKSKVEMFLFIQASPAATCPFDSLKLWFQISADFVWFVPTHSAPCMILAAACRDFVFPAHLPSSRIWPTIYLMLRLLQCLSIQCFLQAS